MNTTILQNCNLTIENIIDAIKVVLSIHIVKPRQPNTISFDSDEFDIQIDLVGTDTDQCVCFTYTVPDDDDYSQMTFDYDHAINVTDELIVMCEQIKQQFGVSHVKSESS